MTKAKKHVVFLEGKRLYLRDVEESDLPHCQRWINDERIRYMTGAVFPLNALGERHWFEQRSSATPRSDIHLAIVLKQGRRHVGVIGLHEIDWVQRSGVTGMIVGEEDARGKGYGHEAKELLLKYAFDSLGLHRIGSFTLATNAQSIACLKKSGYREEGRLREAYFRDGKFVDKLAFGLLADEWRARQK